MIEKVQYMSIKYFNKFISTLCAFIICFSSLPISALASSTDSFSIYDLYERGDDSLYYERHALDKKADIIDSFLATVKEKET